jgi:hypothetical protein
MASCALFANLICASGEVALAAAVARAREKAAR